MRKFLLILGLIAMMTPSQAAPVTVEQARNEAASFVANRQGAGRSLKLAASEKRLTSAVDMGLYYVFNIGQDGGFVIVSGDDRTVPILGYSDEGRFDAARVPANLQAWLDSYAAQMQELDRLTDAQAQKELAAPRRATVVKTRNSIAPLITTRWDQASPYWNECPEFMSITEQGDTVGDLAYTGCVATSMSQIMKFYNWPEKTTQAIKPYQFTVAGDNYSYSLVTTDEMPVTTFDWEHMRDSYTGSEDEQSKAAVAHLMVYAGHAVKSSYGLSATGAYTDDIPKGLTEYFAYDKSTIQIKFRIDFTQDAWNDIVYQELAAGRPLIYNGTAGSGGGHSFVCDGYEYGDYYHINWGWGGMGNGYFQLAVLNPRASGIGVSSSAEGYNMRQNAIIGIQPGDPAGTEPEPQVEDILTATGLSLGLSAGYLERDNKSKGFSIYKSKTLNLNYADHVGTQKKYDIGMALYDEQMNFVQLVINRGVYVTALTSALGSDESFGSNINDARNAPKFGAGLTGKYYMIPVCQLQGSTEWKPMLETDRFYYEVQIDDYMATFTTHPAVNLEVLGFECEGGEKVGVSEQVHVTIQNNSTDRFFGDLYLWFGNQHLDDVTEYTTSVQAEVPAGGKTVVTFNVMPESSGTQSLRVSTDYAGAKMLAGTGSVTIAPTVVSTMNLTVDIEAENADGLEIYDSFARFKVDITNNGQSEYNKYVLAPLFIVDPESYSGEMVTYQQRALRLAPGETETLYFDFDNLGYDQYYSLNIYARNENDSLKNIVTPGGSVFYKISRGMVVWNGQENGRKGYAASGDIVVPADALAVRLEGLDITSVQPNANPNTIYLLGEQEQVPAGLEQSNVVLGKHASKVALHDGFGYFIPQSVEADVVTYERTFEQERTVNERRGWTTIVLPFAPAQVRAGEQELTAQSDYWLYRFAQEADGEAVFEPVEAMETNVPYIIAAATGHGLTAAPVVWSAENVTLKADPIAYTSGKNYLMDGTYVPLSLSEVYTVDAAGARCVKDSAEQEVLPFRVYFSALGEVDDDGVILLPGEPTTSPIKGDVNNDGEISVADVTALVNLILIEEQPTGDLLFRADVNDDSEVGVADVTMLVNMILNQD